MSPAIWADTERERGHSAGFKERFPLVNSLLTAIVRADGEALVMHVGERPYVVAASGPVELSSRPLTLEAVTGMLGQLLPHDARRALDELGAIEHDIPGSAASHGDRFSVVAARGGDDIWIEVRRHRRPQPTPQPTPQPVVAPAQPAPIASAPPFESVAAQPVVAAPAAAPPPPPRALPDTVPVGQPAVAAEVAPASMKPLPVAPPIEVPPPRPIVVAAPEPVAAPQPVEPEPVAEAQAEPPVETPSPISEVFVVPPPQPAHEPAPVFVAPPSAAVEAAVAAAAALTAAGVAAPSVSAAAVGEAVPAPPAVAPPAVAAPAVAEAAVTAPALPAPAIVPVAAARTEEMSFEAIVDASLKAAAPASESIMRPLAAAPIVERPPVESILFDGLVYQAPPKDAPVTTRPMATPPEPAPPVVRPLARSAVRMDVQTRTFVAPRVVGIDRLLRLAAARGASTLFLMAQARPSVRADGEIGILDDEPALTAGDVEELLLEIAPEQSREMLLAGEGVEWMTDIAEVGHVRCQSFRDHRGLGGVFRLVSTRPTSAEQLGLAREVQALCAESEGLILVAGPRACGKSTLVSSLVDLINRTRNDYVVVIESQIKFVHESRGCLVSQREAGGGNAELAAAVRAAVRENPDVLVIDDMRSTEAVRLGLEAMEAGLLVIGGVSAPGAEPALAKILARAPMRLALAEGLRGVISQVLLRKAGGGRVAAREVLLNTPTVAKLIAEGRLNQLPLAIDAGRKQGMVPLNDALAAFVQSGAVDVKEAYHHAFERQAFLAVLRREGIDTTFAERLA